MSGETKTQQGYLVLADISGFTEFLAQAELDHAHEILRDLLELIVGRFKPLLRISKLEGDAVFAYAPVASLPQGEVLLETIEATYVAFRQRRESMLRSTTCTCRACKGIAGLDLKFFTHFGEYILPRVAGVDELLGSDVNLVHRLLKNQVTEVTGWRAYGLFTARALAQMGVKPEGMRPLTETYEHLGDTETFSMDMHARHQELTDQRRELIEPADADIHLSKELALPQQVAWAWASDMDLRNRWMMGAHVTPELRPGGRIRPGATNHCAHGKSVMVETILDWRPCEYFTVQADPGPGLKSRYTIRFEPTTTGTRVHFLMQLQMFGLPRWLTRPLARLMGKTFKMEEKWALLEKLAREELAAPVESPLLEPAPVSS